ncbi:SDR family oxidoreductase [Nostocaceae cyanobacterium CENA357]|uniref:SDR family oxidoreductase n=1 Tax=Atlanticothrix silvestris CENA357 TaxID=1725252 RepID=A0A8J7HPW5_9CYAN|nr:SDR family oxidoreductase [Atlanticothrix silvestris]MBH8556135.1 SDR family oxidoreductase [Atlanticothrix silvestris CENA357]
MKAFVTGATGLLGNNLVRSLVEQGHQVKALVRSPEKAFSLLKNSNVTFIPGDMLDVNDFVPDLEGCDVLFHTAAYFREYYQPGNHWKHLEDININGTINLLTAAEKVGIKKVVYVSSAGIIGMKPNGAPGDETTPPHPIAEKNLYFKSKILTEKAIHQFLQEHTLPVTTILPAWMFGPGDAAPTNSGKLILDYIERKLPLTIPGGTSIVDARDVAQAMINAVDLGKSGEKYILGGRYFSIKDVFTALEKITGIPSPIQLPHAVTVAYAWFSEKYARLSDKEVSISLNGIKAMRKRVQVSSDKAIRELGATFRPLENTLCDEVNWYCQHNYVKNLAIPIQTPSLIV